MDFRIIELEDTPVYGVAKNYDDRMCKNREELRHLMWSEDLEDIPGKICHGKWNEPGNIAYDVLWFGIWQDGRYTIARKAEDCAAEALEEKHLPAGTYAAFRTGRGGLAWEEFPKLFELIFDSWLPASEYRLKSDLVVEVYHLWTDHDRRKKERSYEVWIPVERK